MPRLVRDIRQKDNYKTPYVICLFGNTIFCEEQRHYLPSFNWSNKESTVHTVIYGYSASVVKQVYIAVL